MSETPQVVFPEGKTQLTIAQLTELLGVAPSCRLLVRVLARNEPEVPYEVIGKGHYYNLESARAIAARLAKYREKYPDAGIPRGHQRGRPRRTQMA